LAPSTSPTRDTGQVASQPPRLAPPEPSTSSARDTGQAASAAEPVSDPSALVVLGGEVTPRLLQKRVSHYRNVPHVTGFSVQSVPQKSLQELAARGRFGNRSVSVTTVAKLKEAAQSAGVQIEVIPAPGRGGFHNIVVTPRPLPDTAAEALSKAFSQMPNPSPWQWRQRHAQGSDAHDS